MAICTTQPPTSARRGCRPSTREGDVAGANRIVELFSPREFDFGGLQASGATELVLVDHLDVSMDTEARLNVRNHGGVIGGGASIQVVVYASAPSPQDPARFRAPTELASLAVTPEALRTVAVTEGLGSFVTVAVRGTQGGSIVDCHAVLSAELVLKQKPYRPDSGQRIAALPRTALDFSALAPSATEERLLIGALDVSDYRAGFVALRVHDRDVGADADITVYVQDAFPDDEDPSGAFIGATGDATFVIDAGTTPALHSLRLGPGFGPSLLVRAVATQSAAGGDLAATISFDFVGQE